MKSVLLQLTIVTFILGLFSGCSTGPGPQRAPKSSYTKAGSGPGVPDTTSALPDGEYTVLVESTPAGAIVVVNGIPVGKAPQRVVLPGSARGFFREQVSIKVRFIASEPNQASQTVEELMTPLDRIPAILRFTTQGATRVSR
jgi:hypothetical protein